MVYINPKTVLYARHFDSLFTLIEEDKIVNADNINMASIQYSHYISLCIIELILVFYLKNKDDFGG